ncbi:MAG: extracellular solute-binding protein [Lachnospiraceae bacterium]|nr:extracellular solute-binding protein [Lachnospiraceae bacterium]
MALITSLFSGCGFTRKKKVEKISLSLWGCEEMVPILKKGVDEFNELHKDEVIIEARVSVESESTCKDAVLSDPKHAADLFCFADDQFSDLYNAGVLLEITENTDAIYKSVGGKDTVAGYMITKDDKVYAYPHTAGNGYFLYYNKKYFNEDDITSLDKILEIAKENNKYFSMDYSSGWYIYSFFKGAGLSVGIDDDDKSNECDWNSTDGKYTGVQVCEAMIKIAGNPGFKSLNDDKFVKGVKDGEVIAGINGPWNSNTVKEAWGDDYGAAKLPEYTIAGDSVQMSSFMGYKLIGINKGTKSPKWSMKLAEFLNSREYQLKRYKAVGECPADIEAAKSEEVKNDLTIKALSEQSEYATAQIIADPFWDASGKLGITMQGQNSGNKDLQKLLDATVKEINTIPQ